MLVNMPSRQAHAMASCEEKSRGFCICSSHQNLYQCSFGGGLPPNLTWTESPLVGYASLGRLSSFCWYTICERLHQSICAKLSSSIKGMTCGEIYRFFGIGYSLRIFVVN